jgi:hypothetical protein
MLGAYEGLMKSAPQGMQGPAQSMGGQAMPVGWREAEGSSMQNMKDIIGQMKQIEAMYPDPEMDVHPEHAHKYAALEQDLNQARAMWEHSQGKVTEQAGFKQSIEGGKRTRGTIEGLLKAGSGNVPPPPATAMGR